MFTRSILIVALVLAAFEKSPENLRPTGVVAPGKLLDRQAIDGMLHGQSALPAASPSAWTFCVNAGNVCLFTGLRVVRLADATNTKFVTQVAYHQVPCAGYGFGDRYPSNGPLHCDYGPAIMDTLEVPQKMGPIAGESIVVPRASPGVAVQQEQSGGGDGLRTDGTGSFRTMCSLAKFAFEDPIVFPNRHGVSHLHMFFGNTAMDGSTTSEMIVSTGNSTCRGGVLNRTAYWTPAVIDASGNAVMPEEGTFYYKTGQFLPPGATQPMPTGLRMIAGDRNATGKQTSPDGLMQTVTWSCLTPGLLGVNGPDGRPIPDGFKIPASCPVGAMVRLTVIFPQCWDGKHLDSPNHQSHMAYPLYSRRQCPSTHPVQLPEVTEHFDFPVAPGEKPATWHLSSDMDLSKPGGLSAHADWMMGWDPPTMLALTQNCLQKALDCGVGGLGGNKTLY